MLLERGDLLTTLEDRHREAVAGRGSLVLVSGEAGSGKTTLVRAFTERLDPPTIVLRGACDPLSTPRPLSPLYDLADDPAAGLADLMEGDVRPMDRFARVLDRLRRSDHPIVLGIEDLHWADEGTLDLVRFLARRVSDTPAVVVVTHRDDEIGPTHPVRALLGQLAALEDTHRLAVPPLSPAAVGELAAATPSDAIDPAIDPTELHRVTGGNPFFVTEILASGSAIPQTVQDAVLARVAMLDDEARRALEAMSVLRGTIDVETAVALSDVDPGCLDRATEAGVLVGNRTSVEFRHELARTAIEDGLPPGRRLALHREVIGLLEAADRPDPAGLAHHAIGADDADLIARYAPDAGRQATARGARREAIAFYRAALDHPEALGADAAAGVRVALAAALQATDRPGDAVAELELAIDHYRSADRPEELVDALGQIHGYRWTIQDHAGAWRASEEALTVLRAREPSELLARTLYRAAHTHMLSRRREPAMAAVREAIDVAEMVGSDDVRWLAELIRGCIILALVDGEQGADAIERSLREAEGHSPDRVSMALGMLGTGGGEARLYDRAVPALERAVEHGLVTDEDYPVSYARAWLARIAFEQGRWTDATDLAELVERTTRQPVGIAALTANSALGRVMVRRGDAGGPELLDRLIEIGRNHELQHAWAAICGRAEHHWLAGRWDDAAELLAPAYERALQTDSPWARGELGFWSWRVGAIDRPPAGAAEPFALQMEGRWQAAADRWATIGCPYEEALALADGDAESVRRAVEMFDALGAVPAAAWARQQLRGLDGGPVPRGPIRSTRANPVGLTDRQLDVLRLVVEGLSNGEIATRLFVSKKTVEHHVSAVYAKLGADSRARAIAEARALGIGADADQI